tara:strand:- start:742 stop:2085 length:1344 start_codon:yes stop_codon:yes gene_type:complete
MNVKDRQIDAEIKKGIDARTKEFKEKITKLAYAQIKKQLVPSAEPLKGYPHNESIDESVAKAVQGLNDLGNKMKGRDQKDVRRIEKLYRSGNTKVFQGAIRALDTDLRDQVKDIFDALGMVKQGVIESVDLDEGTLPPALQAYQDKKNGKKPKDDKDEDEVDEGTLPPALQAYQDKKNGKKPKDDKDEDEVDEGTLPPALQAYQDKKNGKKPKDDKDEVEEGRVKDQMVKDSEKMSKKDFTKKYGKENAADLYEAVDNWVVTVAKPVNKLKKGAEQKVKARSAFEAINKAVKLWGDPALKAAPINSFSIKKESIIEGLEEGKMKEFHDYAKEGKSAQWIAKKMSLDMKTVKELMKDMDESTTDKKMLSVSDMNERAMTLPQIANKYKADIAKAQKSGSTASLKKAEKELIAWAMANNEIGNAKEAGDWLDNVVADKDQFAALLKFNS